MSVGGGRPKGVNKGRVVLPNTHRVHMRDWHVEENGNYRHYNCSINFLYSYQSCEFHPNDHGGGPGP